MANVNVTYEEMRAAASQLNKGMSDIDSTLQSLQTLVNQLVGGGYVTDRSSQQFEASYQEFTKGASQVMQGLGGMSTYLTKAADAFEQVDTQLASQLHQH
ncbi:WXG100 family type VII secretion target [Actinocrinis puniceicyclus]|uniref:ESAT-6-like protein n=1 Tax=Actinocrinis puniceicyclus TaxID=977794 RepID=A0A8J7WR50_9ACTN|nr:WXG100 family type VII secretion target [Actinocrinis puniceicyclus]MBS2966943.1 WXG100 family type VII secretion target [Actinocrinis puniceicyclus]